MEEALKNLNIAPKVLAESSNAMWDVLLATEDKAKKLTGSILTSKSVRLQTEYLGTRKTRITLHGGDLGGPFRDIFAQYGQVAYRRRAKEEYC